MDLFALLVPVLVVVCATLRVHNSRRLAVTQFPADCIADVASMQDLVSMHPTVVAPKCFRTVPLSAVTVTPPSATMSMGYGYSKQPFL